MSPGYITIDRGSGIPIAEQIANRLLTAILDGKLDPGERLPPERDLAESLGVSRGTVKRAYSRLVQTQAIDMRQGSGSYVLKNGHILEQNQKNEAAEIITATFLRLRGMGLSEKEILNLVNLHALSGENGNELRKMTIMVVSNNHDILSELEQQLSYLTESSPFLFTLTFLTLGMIVGSPDPLQMLSGYDLIIATTIDYPDILALAPSLGRRTIEARISPRTRTLTTLLSLPEDAKISVVYRTANFRDMVLKCLYSFDFKRENIFCFTDREYNPESHSDNGVSVIVNHNQSPVYTDAAFEKRNREFTEQGGHIIRFEYQLERGSLVYIEDQIQQLMKQAQEAGQE